jgi:hypothetical protein
MRTVVKQRTTSYLCLCGHGAKSQTYICGGYESRVTHLRKSPRVYFNSMTMMLTVYVGAGCLFAAMYCTLQSTLHLPRLPVGIVYAYIPASTPRSSTSTNNTANLVSLETKPSATLFQHCKVKFSTLFLQTYKFLRLYLLPSFFSHLFLF